MKVSADISNSIKIARVWCIYFMVLVHVNPGYPNDWGVALADVDAIILARTVFSGVLGRASVPLLSIISGFLAVYVLTRLSFFRYVYERFKVLIMPMVFWNSLGLLLGVIAYRYFDILTATYATLLDRHVFEHVYASILVLNYESYNEALKFLRDLFVVSLFAPILVICAKKIPYITLAIILIGASFFNLEPFIYRSPILQFFYIGILLHFNPEFINKIQQYRVLVFSLFVLGLFVYLSQAFLVVPKSILSIGLFEWFDWLMRLITSMATWLICRSLIKTRLATVFYAMEKDIYLVYLSHVVFIGVMWIVWKRVIGTEDQISYLLFYFLSPVIVALMAPCLRKLASYLPAVLQYFIKGRVTSVSMALYSSSAVSKKHS